jgi:hypothetical protein
MSEHSFEHNGHTYVLRFVSDPDNGSGFVSSVFEDQQPVNIIDPASGQLVIRLSEEQLAETETVGMHFEVMEDAIRRNGISPMS